MRFEVLNALKKYNYCYIAFHRGPRLTYSWHLFDFLWEMLKLILRIWMGEIMLSKIQNFGSAMLCPVMFMAFSGVAIGLSVFFTSGTLLGD